jgi:hypothetical protein
VTGYLPGDQTLVYYISPDGVSVHLSGLKVTGDPGYWLGAGPDGLGHVEVASLWDAAAIDEGEDYSGNSIDHGELDLPIHVLGTSNSDFQRRRQRLRDLMPRDRQGWFCVYQSGHGWRWVPTRLGSFKPAYNTDPAVARAATFDVILLVDRPHARAANSTAQWAYKGTPGGSLWLYPGPETDGWPRFIFTGPGALQLIYTGIDDAGNDAEMDVTLPKIGAGREIYIDTDMAHQTVRERAATSPDKGTSLWQSMRNKYWPYPIRKGEVQRIRFRVTGAGPTTALWGTVTRRHEGLL